VLGAIVEQVATLAECFDVVMPTTAVPWIMVEVSGR
jgi:hypothetical protein